MAKKCPLTDEFVLYADCLECEYRKDCEKVFPPKPVFALLVVGSRTVTDYSFVKKKLDKLIEPIREKYRFLIVSGGAKGADSLAEIYAKDNGFEFHKMPADWKAHGKKAGFIRNEEMHRFISTFEHRGCAAFWDGESSGTKHSFSLAKKYGNPLRIIISINSPNFYSSPPRVRKRCWRYLVLREK